MVRPWVTVLTSIHKTPIFGRIWVTVAALAAYASLVELVAVKVSIHVSVIGAQFQGFLGLVLGMTVPWVEMLFESLPNYWRGDAFCCRLFAHFANSLAT